jgi:hypothetical protein
MAPKRRRADSQPPKQKPKSLETTKQKPTKRLIERTTRSNPSSYDLRKTYVPILPPPGEPLTYVPSRTVRFMQQLEEQKDERAKRRKRDGVSTMSDTDKRSASELASKTAAINRTEIDQPRVQRPLPGGFIRENEEETDDDEVVEEVTSLRETSVERRHREFWQAKEQLKSAIHKERIQKYREELTDNDDLEELVTSDLEVVTDQLEGESCDIIIGSDYKLDIEVKGLLNRKMFIRESLSGYTRRSFEIGAIEEILIEKREREARGRDVELVEVKIGYKLVQGSYSFRYTNLKSLDIEDGETLMVQLDRHRRDNSINSLYRLVVQVCYEFAAADIVGSEEKHSRAAIISPPPRHSEHAVPILIGSSPPNT